ncbi:MOS1T transposase, partial [Pseudoatta argentina]
DTTCRDWFRRFKNNDFQLEDKERSGASKKFQDKELEQLLDEDPSQTLSELGKILQVDESTVSKRLKGLGMIQKQGHWVPYELLLLCIWWDQQGVIYYEICRLCEEKSSDYITIFEHKDNYIPEKISRRLPIIILPNNNLPSNVFRRCLNYLNYSKLILNAVKNLKYLDQIQAIIIKKELKKIHLIVIWNSKLCDDSFDESNKLITHKTLRHNSNIAICSSCKHIIHQNNKQKIIDENDQTNEKKIIAENIQNDQNIKQEIIDEKSIQNNWKTDQKTINKISYEKQNFIKDEQNIQNNWKTEQETINKISYEKQDVSFIKDIETSINLAINAEIDTVEKESENNLIQALIKQINNRFDSDIYKKIQLKYMCNFSTDLKLTHHLRIFKDPIMTVCKCIICPEVYVDKEFYEKHRNVCIYV